MHYRLFLILSIVGIISGCGGGGGNSESEVAPVVTQNKPPSISVANAPSEVAKGQSLALTATASDEDGSIASVIWQQTAGQVVLAEPTKANSITLDLAPASSFTPKEYVFTVTATDNQGAAVTQSIRFTAFNRMDQFASSRLLHQGSMGPTLNEIRQAQGLSEQISK